MKRIRSAIARLLIRAARKVCVYGFTDDYLAEAYRAEEFDGMRFIYKDTSSKHTEPAAVDVAGLTWVSKDEPPKTSD